jgi:lipooligosaccharide transport system permease protein
MNSVMDDILYFPKWGRGVWCVWRRNFLYFRYTILTAMSWIFLEPLLYLFALGYGLGSYIPEIEGVRYAEFIAPAMLTTTAMFVGFFEGTYGSYTKLSRQNTFHTILLTPVMPDEIVLGEIAWAASKAFMSVVAVGVVIVSLGLMKIQVLLPCLVVLSLLCWCFASIGVFLAAVAKSYETFTYLTSGFITPMSLFCGTYFPLSQLPQVLQWVAQILPLTHGLSAVRILIQGEINPQFVINLFYLIFVGMIFTNLASAKMNKKLIQ